MKTMKTMKTEFWWRLARKWLASPFQVLNQPRFHRCPLESKNALNRMFSSSLPSLSRTRFSFRQIRFKAGFRNSEGLGLHLRTFVWPPAKLGRDRAMPSEVPGEFLCHWPQGFARSGDQREIHGRGK